jgi:hypothetical protein
VLLVGGTPSLQPARAALDNMSLLIGFDGAAQGRCGVDASDFASRRAAEPKFGGGRRFPVIGWFRLGNQQARNASHTFTARSRLLPRFHPVQRTNAQKIADTVRDVAGVGFVTYGKGKKGGGGVNSTNGRNV